MNIPQVKASGILLRWGKFRFMYSHAVFYIGALQMLLIAVTAYNTTIQAWMFEYLGWNIAFWQYCAALVVVLSVGMVLDFVLGVPAFIAIANEQQYKHQNPIKADLEAVKLRQEDMQEKLNKIVKRMGIE